MNPFHDDRGRFDFAPNGGVVPVAGKPGGGKPPPKPPVPTPPKTPATPAPAKPPEPSPTNPPSKKLEDILKPAGQEIGAREGRASPGVRTVSPSEFDQLTKDLSNGAHEVMAPSDYNGKWFERPDGTRFGVRTSPESGQTLEVIAGGSSGIKNGYKVHRK